MLHKIISMSQRQCPQHNISTSYVHYKQLTSWSELLQVFFRKVLAARSTHPLAAANLDSNWASNSSLTGIGRPEESMLFSLSRWGVVSLSWICCASLLHSSALSSMSQMTWTVGSWTGTSLACSNMELKKSWSWYGLGKCEQEVHCVILSTCMCGTYM